MSYKPVELDSATNGTAMDAKPVGQPGFWTRVTDRFPFLRRKRGIAIVAVATLVVIGGGLAGLAALHNRSSGGGGVGSSGPGSGGSGSSNAIASDTHFYGDSPPVYPSRELPCSVFNIYTFPTENKLKRMSLTIWVANITGTGSWTESLSRAQAMVSNMTLDEKVLLENLLRCSCTHANTHVLRRSA